MVLAVVNNSVSESHEKKEDNQKTLKFLNDAGRKFKNRLRLHWIDAASPGMELEGKGGVGKARKTGMDAVLNHLDSNDASLIFCLDADTLVSPNYLSAAFGHFRKNQNSSGAVFRFEHRKGSSETEENAIVSYELFMRYYVEALKFAASPYAYHALGSAIVCQASSYVKAGGMRDKNAGEDFYFLQALRKTGLVRQIDDACVYPAARASDRVPFGTGASVGDICAGKKILAYNPEIFFILREIISAAAPSDNTDKFLRLPEIISKIPFAADFFNEYSFKNKWRGILENTPENGTKLSWAFHTFFDAFLTLKFIHFCENNFPEKFPRATLEKAFRKIPGSSFEFLNSDLYSSESSLLQFLRTKETISND